MLVENVQVAAKKWANLNTNKIEETMKFHKVYLMLLILSSSLAFAGTDVQFLEEMTMHHQQAVHMATMADKKLSSSQIKKMNRKIMKDQKKDISRMAKWKKALSAGTTTAKDKDAGMNMPMDMSMTEMNNLKGKDFDAKYVEMMSAHHGQAVSMVQKYLADLSNPNIKSFAEKTAKTQESEIEKMSKMKKDISGQ